MALHASRFAAFEPDAFTKAALDSPSVSYGSAEERHSDVDASLHSIDTDGRDTDPAPAQTRYPPKSYQSDPNESYRRDTVVRDGLRDAADGKPVTRSNTERRQPTEHKDDGPSRSSIQSIIEDTRHTVFAPWDVSSCRMWLSACRYLLLHAPCGLCRRTSLSKLLSCSFNVFMKVHVMMAVCVVCSGAPDDALLGLPMLFGVPS
jgi:hypothetical protein